MTRDDVSRDRVYYSHTNKISIIHRMEIGVINSNFSFYHSTQSIYCTGEVIEFSIQDCQSPYLKHFNTVSKGQKINLKYTGDDFRRVLDLLTNRIIKVRVTAIEPPQDQRYKEKFIISKISTCGFFAEN